MKSSKLSNSEDELKDESKETLKEKLKKWWKWTRDYIIAGLLGLSTSIIFYIFFPKFLIKIIEVLVIWLVFSAAWLLLTADKIFPKKKKGEEKRRW